MVRFLIRAAFAFLVLISGSLVVFAQEVTGTWTGTVSGFQRCDSGGTVAFNGSATAGFLQTGTSLIGTVTTTLLAPDESNCQPGSSATIVLLVSGTVSSNAINGTVVVPLLGTFSMSGSVTGTSMSLTSGDELVTVSINLNRTGTGGAPAGLTGAYNGSYSFRETVRNCSNLTVKTYSGSMSGSLVQTGNSLAGLLGITGAKHTDRDGNVCSLRDDVGVVPNIISASVNGSSISGLFVADDDVKQGVLTATADGNTITGRAAWAEDDAQLDFTITRTGTALLPFVLEFSAEPDSITSGQSATLMWRTLNATGVTIDHGVGGQASSGTAIVTPSVTTTYTLVASGSGATATATARVAVSSGTPANVIVSSLPRGLVQAVGQPGTTDSYTLTNIGGQSTNITLTQVGTFFSHSPTSFALAAGESQLITIQATQQPAGTFNGSSNPSGNGVAQGTNVQVRMLVAATPNGTVRPRANLSRVIAESTGLQTGGGQISITNQGTAAMQALLVADVPWIVHDNQPVTIAAGQTAPLSFSVDPSKRPDADALLGSATGSLSLRFLPGAANTGTGPVTHDASENATLNITIVSVVKPGSTSGSPPSIPPGGLAFYVPGLSSKAGAIGDLSLVSRAGSLPISDLQLFYTQSFGGTFSQVSTLPPLPGNVSVAFPSTVTSVFGNISQTGTVQLRSAQMSKVSVAGSRVNATNGIGTFSGALPLLRSDRSISSGESLLLTGVQKSSGIQTDLYIQEVSGSQASAQIEFLDSNGAVASTAPTIHFGPFGFSESIDAVPANAAAIRITKTGANPGRLSASGLVLAAASGDGWGVEDPAAGAAPTDTFYIPLISGAKDSQTQIFVTNRTSAPKSFTLDIVSRTSRRRGVRSSGAGAARAPVIHDSQSHTLGGFATRQVSTPVSGYAKIRSDAGAVVVVARNVVSTSTSGVPTPFGSSMPAVASSSALAAGEGQRFGSIDDASIAARLASAPGTFRTSLVLLETAGSSATVRVTVAFQYPASSKVTGIATASRAYVLPPSQSLVISDLAGSVIGANRQAFGDLRAMVVDVDVVQGSGRVIPFVVSVDNGSGDMSVRRN